MRKKPVPLEDTSAASVSSTALRQLLRTRVIEHWGHRYRVTPRLIDKVWGDGQKLVRLYPINYRPHHWIVRCDSKITDDDWWGILDDIYEAIDEQFGVGRDEDGEQNGFPTYDGEGSVWEFCR